MFGLPSLTIWSKLIIFAAWTAAVAVFTGVKVADYVSTGYENILLNQKVSVVTKEREVAVLDQKTLSQALARAKRKWEQEQQVKDMINDVIRKHEADSSKPWCELTPDELRLWNSENSGDFKDNPESIIRSHEELSNTEPSEIREAGRSVEKQDGNSPHPQ